MVRFVPEADSRAGRLLGRLGKLLGLRSETVYSRAILLLALMFFIIIGTSVIFVWRAVPLQFEAEDKADLLATAKQLKTYLEARPTAVSAAELSEISTLLDQRITLRPADVSTTASSFEGVRLRSLPDGSTAAVFILKHPGASVPEEATLVSRHSFGEAGKHASRIIVVGVTLMGGVMLLLMLLIVDRTVLFRIQLLADKVENEKKSERLPVRLNVEGDDEIAQLAASMEELARLVQTTERAYRASEIVAAKKLQESQKQLELLSARLVHLQDRERRRIARELHDSTAQNLSALEINMSVLASMGENETMRQLAGETAAISRQICRELRNISYLLHPPLLDEEGLAFAIRWFANGFEKRNNIPVILDLPENSPRLDEEIETALFRIVQESFRNIYRHSGATKVWVSLQAEENGISLEIRDNGRGLPEDFSITRSSGVGLAGMRERVKQLGGTFEVSSSEYGVSVSCKLQNPEKSDAS